jgi:hypothetical protein
MEATNTNTSTTNNDNNSDSRGQHQLQLQEETMDETEDEEVKRNCFGRKFYTSSCSDESDSESETDHETDEQQDSDNTDVDEDDDTDDEHDHDHESVHGDVRDEYSYSSSTVSSTCTCDEPHMSGDEEPKSSFKPQPVKFTFDISECEPGINIFRPKPIPIQKLKDYNKNSNCKHGIVHERVCTSTSTLPEDDDREVDGVDDSSIELNEQDCEHEESDMEVSSHDNFDDRSIASSDSTDSDISIQEDDVKICDKVVSTNTLSFHDSADDGDASISDNGGSDDEEDEEEEDIVQDEEESTSSDEDFTTPNYESEEEDEDNYDYESDHSEMKEESEHEIDVIVIDHNRDQDSHDKEDGDIEIEWEDVLNGKGSDNEDGNDEESEYNGIRYINAIAVSGSVSGCEGSNISAEDLESIMEKAQEEEESPEAPKCEGVRSDTLLSKRSFEVVDALGDEQSHGSNKRIRTTHELQLSSLPLLPSLTLPNESSTFPKLEILNGGKLALRELTPCEDNSENDDEVDTQLAEELMGYVSPTPIEGNSNPIPLLTPPASPLPIKSDESVVEICEWPSNLAVDNALTAAIELRPLSPSSLAKLEEDDQRNEPLITPFPRKIRSVTRDFLNSPLGSSVCEANMNCGLTPTLGTMMIWDKR